MALVSCTIYPLSVILLDVIKHSINDGNLGNNGHSIQPTSQAAMAEEFAFGKRSGRPQQSVSRRCAARVVTVG